MFEHSQSLLLSSCHPGVVYLEPKVSREVGVPSESTFHFSTLCLDEILRRPGKAIRRTPGKIIKSRRISLWRRHGPLGSME